MSTNATTILHLSDLHFGYEGDVTGRVERDEVLQGLLRTIAGLKSRPDILVISGDLTCRGRGQGYIELAAWLSTKLLKQTNLTPNEIIICPGNHDVDRDEAEGLQDTTDDPERSDALLRPEKLARNFARPFHRFKEFAADLGIPAPTLQGEDNYLVGVRDLRPRRNLRFVIANSAWFCRNSSTDQGHLWLGLPQLRAMSLDRDSLNDGLITIAVVHHPAHWLTNSDFTSYPTRPAAYDYLAERVHLILSGHTHGAIGRADRIKERAWVLISGATYDSYHYLNNFSLLRIEGRTLTRLPFQYDPAMQRWEQSGDQVYSLHVDPVPSPSTASRSNSRVLYLEWLKGETSQVDLRNLVDPQYRPDIDALYTRLERKVDSAAMERSSLPLETALTSRRLFITGEAGSGKSTFLRRVAWALCRPANTERLLDLSHLSFPIYVRVRELDEHIQTAKSGPRQATDPAWLPHFLAKEGRWGLDEFFWTTQLAQADSILLLDGLDEAANADRRAHLGEMLAAVSKTAACHIAVTTRSMDLSPLDPEIWQTVRIEPLDRQGIGTFLLQWSRWLKNGNECAAEEYCAKLANAVATARVPALVGNPLMLTSLAVLYLNGQELPKHRAGLFEGIVDWLSRHAHEHCRDYSKEEYRDKLSELALAMQSNPTGQVLKVDENTAATMITVRGRALEPAIRFLGQAQLHSGLITLRDKHFEFWHRSFQEYLAARCMVGFLDEDRLATARKLLYSSENADVLAFLSARLSPYQLGHLVSGLTRVARRDKSVEKQVQAVGVLGRMIAHGPPCGLEQRRPYLDLMSSVLGVFDKSQAHLFGVKARADAAHAIYRACPGAHLHAPPHNEYWSSVLSGVFRLGGDLNAYSSFPEELVTVKPFRIGRFPATVWEYSLYLDRNPDVPMPDDWDSQLAHLGNPVVYVDWHDADRYCRSFGPQFKLASEEQWEFAARGSSNRIYTWEGPRELGEINRRGAMGGVTPVGIFPLGVTPEGVSDLLGNVWEWTLGEVYDGVKVVRGGSFLDDADELRTAYRNFCPSDQRRDFIGFRCVREVIF